MDKLAELRKLKEKADELLRLTVKLSDKADLSPDAGAITSALFLSGFIGQIIKELEAQDNG